MVFPPVARGRLLFRFFLFGIPAAAAGTAHAQSDVVVLQKYGRNLTTYAPGQRIIFETIYRQWFDGYVTAIRNDSVFFNNIPFHFKEIRTLRRERQKLNYVQDGTLLIIAGGGVVALNVINGLYRKDKPGQWFSTGGWITAGALLAGGFLLRRARNRTYPIGKKYQLHYLDLHNDDPRGVPGPAPGSP